MASSPGQSPPIHPAGALPVVRHTTGYDAIASSNNQAIVLLPELAEPLCLGCIANLLSRRQIDTYLLSETGRNTVEVLNTAAAATARPASGRYPSNPCRPCLLDASGILVSNRSGSLAAEPVPLDRQSLLQNPALGPSEFRQSASQPSPGSTKPHIIAIIPAYNEERFIGSVVLNARHYAQEVVVVDDGSTDETWLLAKAAGARVLRHPSNQGKGVALNSGFDFARRLDADIFVTIDADGQHHPQDIHQLVAPIRMGQADVVIGSRYLDRRSQVPRPRIVGHWLFNLVSHHASGIRTSDSQSGYRAFSRHALQRIKFTSKGFSVESELQFLVKALNLRLVDVPVVIHYRDAPKRSIYRQGLAVLAGIIRLVGQYRPLLFFSVPGIAMLACSLAIGLRIPRIYDQSHLLAFEHSLVSLALFGVGALSIFSGIILHSVRGMLFKSTRDCREIPTQQSKILEGTEHGSEE